MTDWDALYRTANGCRWWPNEELVRASAARVARRGPLQRALEVGCGNGANLWLLAERAARVTGLDVSVEAIERAEAYMRQRRFFREGVCRNPVDADVTFDRGTLEMIHYADASFDAVVDVMTSQHVTWADHAALYGEYRRVLQPGGWLFIYHLDSLTRTRRDDWRGDYDYGVIGLFSEIREFCLPPPESLERAVIDAGFELGGRSGFAREYENGDVAHYTVIDAEVPS